MTTEEKTPVDANLHSNVTIDFTKKRITKPKLKINPQGTKPSLSPRPQIVKKASSTGDETPVRICSLLGLEQVGQCVFIEYKDDIILVDAGLEFCAQEILGADYVIPDIAYIKKNIKKLRGIVLTHGHLDHIWALRDILPELDFPVIYTTPLTLGIVKKSFEDPKDVPKIKYKIVNPETDIIKLGCFTIEFVHVNHNIPETMALAIHTPKGIIFNSADFKIDHTPAIDKPADLAKIARIGTEGVKLYIGDSLGSERPWFAISEMVVGQTLDDIIKNTRSRLLIATFASNVWRIIQIIQSAARYNKVVFLSGRSMVNNVEICKELGYINVPKWLIRKLGDDIHGLSDDRIVILSTGAQWEEFSSLARMARGEHTKFELKKWDTILMSATTIPGNELAVAKMMNDLVVREINLITNNDMDVHASGHWGAEDHKIMIGLLKPQFFMPFYTDAKSRYAHKKLGLMMGIPEENIMMPAKNGAIIEMYDDRVTIAKDTVKLNTVLIDGKGVGHLSGEYVIKARKIMAEDGLLALIFKIDTKTKELVGNIQIESRWFVYSSEVRMVHTKIVDFARSKYHDYLKKRKDTKQIMKDIKEDLGEQITKIIGRVPMVLTMYVYINRDQKDEIIDVIADDEAIIWMTLEEQGGYEPDNAPSADTILHGQGTEGDILI